jgi:hypothetical protein
MGESAARRRRDNRAMTLRRALHKLRLKEGDILIVRTPELMQRLAFNQMKLKFRVLLLYAENKNDIIKMSRKELLERLDGHS